MAASLTARTWGCGGSGCSTTRPPPRRLARLVRAWRARAALEGRSQQAAQPANAARVLPRDARVLPQAPRAARRAAAAPGRELGHPRPLRRRAIAPARAPRGEALG